MKISKIGEIKKLKKVDFKENKIPTSHSTTNFHYNNLNQILFDLHQKNIKSITISLLISLEKEYYEGDNLINILKDLKRLTHNKTIHLDYNSVQTDFEVSKIQIEVGDTLNRHMWYYRFCEEYLLENNLDEEKQIPEAIRNEFNKKAYKKGKEQGLDWFARNIEAVNSLMPENHKLIPSFKLKNEITTLYQGDETYPEIEFVCYEYWLNYPRYKAVENALTEVRNLPDSIIERAYNHEANYFYERLSKRQDIHQKDLFIKQSKKYLIDETMPSIIKHSNHNNLLEFYFGGRENNHTQVCKGKKAQRDLRLKKYFETSLKGADKRKFIGIQKIK